MIWIIGGTSETREILLRINDLNNYIVTAATEEAREFIQSDKLIIGRLSLKEMESMVYKKNIKLIVDLTHPYAKIVSENAKIVAKENNIKYIRYVRKTLENMDNVIYLNNYEATYKYLKKIEGTVFFTTGSKNIGEFEKVRGNNRFIYRILPALPSIETANKNEVEMKNIVAVLGPFSKDYNKIMLSEYNADYCVSKDSGTKGGVEEKIEACKELGIKMILIGRDEEEGYDNLDEIENIIRKMSRR